MAREAYATIVTGSLDRARSQYAEIALRAPHDPDVHAALGSIALSQGNRAEALREWRLALEDGIPLTQITERLLREFLVTKGYTQHAAK